MDCSSVLRYYEGSDSCRRHLDGRSPRFSRDTFPTFRLQPRDAPRHRFPRQFQRAGRVSDFALNEQARRYIPPNRVRFTTDRQFASSCSPPRLSTTQLPSASGSWLAPTRTYTVLISRLHGRTHSRECGNPGISPKFNQPYELDSRLRGITSDLASVFCSLSRLVSSFTNDGLE
jgi:hypothetical protein